MVSLPELQLNILLQCLQSRFFERPIGHTNVVFISLRLLLLLLVSIV